MITQLEEDNANMTLQKNKISREPLRQAVETMVNMAEKRVKAGETNVRGHMFYSMVSSNLVSTHMHQTLNNLIFTCRT